MNLSMQQYAQYNGEQRSRRELEHENDKHFGKSFSESKYLREIERDRRLRLEHQRTTVPLYGYGDGSKSRSSAPVPAVPSFRSSMRESRRNHVNRNSRKVVNSSFNVIKSFYMHMPPDLKAYTHCMIYRLAMHYGYVRKLALYVTFSRWRGWVGCLLLQTGIQAPYDLSARSMSQPVQWQHIVLQHCHRLRQLHAEEVVNQHQNERDGLIREVRALKTRIARAALDRAMRKLRDCTARWRQAKQVEAWQRWWWRSVCGKSERSTLRRAVSAAQHRRLRVCLRVWAGRSAWVRWDAQRQEEWKIAAVRRCVHGGQHAALATAWRRWVWLIVQIRVYVAQLEIHRVRLQLGVQQQQHGLREMMLCVRKMSDRVFVQAWQKWRGWVAEGAAAEQLMRRWLGLFVKRFEYAAWSQWREECKAAGAVKLMMRCLRRLVCGILAHGWERWRDMVRVGREDSVSAELARLRMQLLMARQQHGLREMMLCVRKMSDRVFVQAWQKWRGWVAEGAAAEQLMRRWLGLFVKRFEYAAWSQWREECKAAGAVKLMMRCLRRLVCGILAHGWERWRDMVRVGREDSVSAELARLRMQLLMARQQHGLREMMLCVRKMSDRVFVQAWQKWRGWVAEGAAAEQLMRRWLGLFVKRFEYAAWSQWREECKAAGAVKLMMRCLRRLVCGILAHGWERWRDMVRVGREDSVSAELARLRMQLLMARQQHGLREMMLCVRKMSDRVFVQAWQKWRGWVAEGAAAEQLMRRWLGLFVKRFEYAAWSQWREECKAAGAVKLMMRCLRRLVCGILAHGWERWRDMVRVGREDSVSAELARLRMQLLMARQQHGLREMMLCVRKMSDRVFVQAWQKWRGWVAEGAAAEQLMRRWLGLFVKRFEYAAWSQWREECKAAGAVKLMMRCLRRLVCGILAHGWERWRDMVRVGREDSVSAELARLRMQLLMARQQHGLREMMLCVRKMSDRVFVQAWQKWRGWVAEGAAAEQLMRRWLGLFVKRFEYAAWSQWREECKATGAVKLMVRCLRRLVCGILAHGWERWRVGVRCLVSRSSLLAARDSRLALQLARTRRAGARALLWRAWLRWARATVLASSSSMLSRLAEERAQEGALREQAQRNAAELEAMLQAQTQAQQAQQAQAQQAQAAQRQEAMEWAARAREAEARGRERSSENQRLKQLMVGLMADNEHLLRLTNMWDDKVKQMQKDNMHALHRVMRSTTQLQAEQQHSTEALMTSLSQQQRMFGSPTAPGSVEKENQNQHANANGHR